MQPSSESTSKPPVLSNIHLLVLLPFYCACILLLGANLFRDRCCEEMQQQIQGIEPRLLDMNARLERIQNGLAGIPRPVFSVTANANLSRSGDGPASLAKDFLMGLLTDSIVNGISSLLQEEQRVVVNKEIKNQVFNFFETTLAPGENHELSIYFDIGSPDICPSGKRRIEALRELLKQHPERRVVVSGFADRLGDPSSNRGLALSRANAVAGLLRGVKADIHVEGAAEGEDRLPIPTDDEVSEPLNRVVTIRW